MNNLNFGVPNLRQPKQEKYPNQAYLILHPTGEGLGRKMELSEKALELLNVTDENNQVSFSFSGADIYIVNTSGNKVSGLKIGKTTNGFSDKKHYNYIKGRMFNLADSEILELFFEETEQEFNSNKVFKLIQKIDNVDNNVSDCANSACSNHAIQQEIDEQADEKVTMFETFTQEELDALQSNEYAKNIEVNTPIFINEEENTNLSQ